MESVMGKGCKITAEIKASILAELTSGGGEISGLAKRYSLSERTIRKLYKQSLSPAVTKAAASQFFELKIADLEEPVLPKPKQLQISIKSGEISLTLDGAIKNDQLSSVFKLIEVLC